MSASAVQARPPGSVYTDVLGRRWAVEKLDRLLADPEVNYRVSVVADAVAIPAEGTFNPGAALMLVRDLHTRPSVSALWLLLVVRHFDTDGAHSVGRGVVE